MAIFCRALILGLALLFLAGAEQRVQEPGLVTAAETGCDAGIAIDSFNPLVAAKALGLCTGVSTAAWLLPDGASPPSTPPTSTNYHLGHGIKTSFGPNVPPQEGASLLVLSTGTARVPSDAGYNAALDKGYSHNLPAGFSGNFPPKCPSPGAGQRDGIALEVIFQAPAGTTGFSFDWNYFTREWPEFACTEWVDAPAVMHGGVNIMLDGFGRTVSGSNPMDVCRKQDNGANHQGDDIYVPSLCALGSSQLQGTGFEVNTPSTFNLQHAATGWHTSSGLAKGGQTYTVTFAIWDTSDGLYDSTVLFDNWRWLVPPNSDPGGPYTYCIGRPAPFILDGSQSSHPGGTIQSYEWDWTPPLNFTPPDATGATVNATAAFSSFAPGTYNLALRVTDNDLISDTDFTTVTVFSVADCPLPPDADGDGVSDADDNCPKVPNTDQVNHDPDPQGDACDLDDDNDGYTDADELTFNPDENTIVYCAIMRADVNHDHTVTIADLATVAGAFLQSPPANPRLDQGMTPDNVITIGDLAAMAAEFLKPVTGCP